MVHVSKCKGWCRASLIRTREHYIASRDVSRQPSYITCLLHVTDVDGCLIKHATLNSYQTIVRGHSLYKYNNWEIFYIYFYGGNNCKPQIISQYKQRGFELWLMPPQIQTSPKSKNLKNHCDLSFEHIFKNLVSKYLTEHLFLKKKYYKYFGIL